MRKVSKIITTVGLLLGIGLIMPIEAKMSLKERLSCNTKCGGKTGMRCKNKAYYEQNCEPCISKRPDQYKTCQNQYQTAMGSEANLSSGLKSWGPIAGDMNKLTRKVHAERLESLQSKCPFIRGQKTYNAANMTIFVEGVRDLAEAMRIENALIDASRNYTNQFWQTIRGSKDYINFVNTKKILRRVVGECAASFSESPVSNQPEAIRTEPEVLRRMGAFWEGVNRIVRVFESGGYCPFSGKERSSADKNRDMKIFADLVSYLQEMDRIASAMNLLDEDPSFDITAFTAQDNFQNYTPAKNTLLRAINDCASQFKGSMASVPVSAPLQTPPPPLHSSLSSDKSPILPPPPTSLPPKVEDDAPLPFLPESSTGSTTGSAASAPGTNPFAAKSGEVKRPVNEGRALPKPPQN